MVDNSLDKHILLVSADWFEPFLAIFWPNVAEDKVASVKLAARESVKEMLSTSAVYWNIPFSKERLDKTEKAYSKRLHKIGLSNGSIDDLMKRSGSDDLSDEVARNTLWLFWTLTEHFMSLENVGPLANLDGHKKAIIRKIYQDINEKRFSDNLERAFNASETEWDNYLKSLTPDLPSFLYDYAEIHIAGIEKFRIFWMEINKILDVNARKLLVQWYLDEVKEIADPDFKLRIPGWLDR